MVGVRLTGREGSEGVQSTLKNSKIAESTQLGDMAFLG